MIRRYIEKEQLTPEVLEACGIKRTVEEHIDFCLKNHAVRGSDGKILVIEAEDDYRFRVLSNALDGVLNIQRQNSQAGAKKGATKPNTSLAMEIVDNPKEAPNYNKMPSKWTGLEITKAVIVKNGTVQGNSTVDLQMRDEEGNQYLVMATGRILKTLAAAIPN